MKRLLTTLGWDFLMFARYQIVTVVLVISAIYILILRIIPVPDMVVQCMIFSDPVMLGFIFTGAIVLFEKGANTLEALVVTPIKIWEYLWSKAIALTLLALPCTLTMAIAGHGWDVHYLWLILGLFLSSILFVFVGFIGVSRVKNFNQYIVVIPLFLVPFSLPLLNFLGLMDCYAFYIIPTQASLILFEATFKEVEVWKLIYSIGYLLISMLFAYKLARKAFINYIIGDKS